MNYSAGTFCMQQVLEQLCVVNDFRIRTFNVPVKLKLDNNISAINRSQCPSTFIKKVIVFVPPNI
jgi:hypothetical protein